MKNHPTAWSADVGNFRQYLLTEKFKRKSEVDPLEMLAAYKQIYFKSDHNNLLLYF